MPTTTRPAGQQILTAIGHLIWTSIVVVGAPVALWQFFGWPLPAEMPDWGEVVSTPLQLVDPIVILNTFVCLAWICWTILMAYVALDVIDTARGVGQRIHRIGPFGTVAAKMVGSAVLLASLARPTVSLAAPAAPTPVVHVVDATAFATTPAVYLLAEGHLTSASPIVDTTSAPTPVPAADPVYVVQRGDSLWAIAEAQLGSGFRWTEIHDLNRSFIADPDIICIGWQLKLPADALSALPAPSVESTRPPASPEEVPVVPAEPDAREPASPHSERPPAEVEPATTAEQAPEAQTRVAEEPPVGASSADLRPAADASAEGWMPALASSVPGITGATVLSTGVLLLLRRRRRRISGPTPRRQVSALERSIVAAADVPLVRWVGQELAILGELIAGRRHPAVPVAIEFSEATGIEILWDQPFLDAPAPWEAMPGGWSWRTTYDAEAPVPVAERPSPIPGLVTVGRREGRQLMVNLEALGTVSVAGDPNAAEGLIRSIVVELATCDEIADAAVAVTDDVPIKLGDGDVGIDVLTAVQVADVLAEAGRNASDAVEGLETSSTFGYRTYSTPVLPLPVTVVAADPSHPAIGDAAENIAPNCGASLVLLGRSSAADAQIDVMSDGTATIHPLGLTFEAALLPPSTEVDIGALLADAPEHDIEGDQDEVRGPETPVPGSTQSVGALPLRPWWLEGSDLDVSADEVTACSSGVAEEQPGEDAVEWSIDLRAGSATTAAPLAGRSLPPKMLVKVLGAPRIVDGPNLGRRELNVVVFIACSHRPVSHEHIQDAIWGGGAISTKSVFNLIGSARTALGRWDEEPVLSTAKRPHNTIELHPDVRTDLDLLRDLVAAAEAAPSNDALALLLEALELVEGPPFDAAGYDWALTNQLVSEAEHLIERAASTAAEIAIEQGDLARARWAVTVGLRAIPGDEALYRIRMRIEDAAGNSAAVRRAYDELAAHLDEFGEEPSGETLRLLDCASSKRKV